MDNQTTWAGEAGNRGNKTGKKRMPLTQKSRYLKVIDIGTTTLTLIPRAQQTGKEKRAWTKRREKPIDADQMMRVMLIMGVT